MASSTAQLLEHVLTARLQLEDKMGDVWKLAQLRSMKKGSTFVLQGSGYTVVAAKKGEFVVKGTKGKVEKMLTLPKKPGYYAHLMSMGSTWSSKKVSLSEISVGGSADMFLKKKAAEKAMKKAATASYSHDYKVGDILYTSWGYDQTNVDFFEVVKVPSGKTIHVQEVAARVTKSQPGADMVVPVPGHAIGPILKKRVIGGAIKIHSSANAIAWGGKPVYQTPSGQGH
jgi:hypothetical protein